MTDLIPLDSLATQANSYASAHGVQVERRNAQTGGSYFECAPMSLLPNAYPQQAFAQAQEVAPAFNELVDRVSRDAAFLQETLGGGVSDMDPYTAQLLKLYNQVYVDAPADRPALQADRLGIHRSDYMLHAKEPGTYLLKQVELNTIAASFAGLSSKIFDLHRYLTRRFQDELTPFLEINQKVVAPHATAPPAGVPANPTLDRLPKAMALAYQRYVDRHALDASKAIVLFVVQEGETNTVDQRLLEFRLFEEFKIPVVRMSLTKASTELSLDESTGQLTLDGKEIAVVYFRAGYAPTDFPDGDDGKEWKARLTLELSRAAKCPSLGYHLAGTKKVQQELARPGVVERFVSDPAKVAAMRACFAGLYSLGDDATDEDLQAVRDIVLNGQQGKYVLKPQREGGGYNFYGDSLAAKLKDLTKVEGTSSSIVLDKQLAEYILMERLFPPEQKAILVRGGRVEGTGDSVSELGCYGTLIVDASGTIVHNEYAGFLLRTKFSNVDEGGVASGFATLSSPYLC
eukprot:Nitzschia sp. Nitz4//scaffold22_size323478//117302//118849//NITZ4_000521-RA/size323478-processed-gene-0.395-mRNA-1//1//CDS//3329542977//509//frame0